MSLTKQYDSQIFAIVHLQENGSKSGLFVYRRVIDWNAKNHRLEHGLSHHDFLLIKTSSKSDLILFDLVADQVRMRKLAVPIYESAF